MEAQAIELYQAQGPQAAVAFLQEEQAGVSPVEQIKAFNDVVRHAYWEKKDLPAAIQIGQAGIVFSEQLLAKYPDQADEILAKQKALYYNLASFTWPGWNEKGITVSEEQVQLGLEAARHNLRLAKQLRKVALPCSRAYWMLAAQELAAKQYPQATVNFLEAERLARQAEAEGEALLAAGFVAVVGLLENPGDPTQTAHLEEIQQALRPLDHGKIFIAQLVDALKMFGG